MAGKKFDRHKLKALFDAQLDRHEKAHKDHEAAVKKMVERQAKARQEMYERHRKARAKLHAEILKAHGANPLHDHPRSK